MRLSLHEQATSSASGGKAASIVAKAIDGVDIKALAHERLDDLWAPTCGSQVHGVVAIGVNLADAKASKEEAPDDVQVTLESCPVERRVDSNARWRLVALRRRGMGLQDLGLVFLP